MVCESAAAESAAIVALPTRLRQKGRQNGCELPLHGLIGAAIPVINHTQMSSLRATFATFWRLTLFNVLKVLKAVRVSGMRVIIAVLLATASFFSPLSVLAGSDDVEATIKAVDVEDLSMTLDDGKTYSLPEEFNFDGLESGVKVIVFYTEVDGKRVVDDLEIVQ